MPQLRTGKKLAPHILRLIDESLLTSATHLFIFSIDIKKLVKYYHRKCVYHYHSYQIYFIGWTGVQ